MNNIIYINLENDQQRFFKSEESRKDYLKSEEEVRKQPLRISFDWKYFLKVILGLT